MRTLKGTKRKIIKEYNLFLKDYKLDRNIYNVTQFAKAHIEAEVKENGFFENKNFKKKNIINIQAEIEQICNEYEVKRILKEYKI